MASSPSARHRFFQSGDRFVERSSKRVAAAQIARIINRNALLGCLFFSILLICDGCQHGSQPIRAMTHGTALVPVDLSVPAQPKVLSDDVHISCAKNAWSQWALQLDAAQLPAHPILRLPDLAPGIELTASQVLPAPVDLNDAGYVRQTGDRADATTLPRALLPLVVKDRAVDLAQLRDPANPSATTQHTSHGPVLIWIDLHTTDKTPAGSFNGVCQLNDQQANESVGELAIHLTVENITLPVEPHLHFAADLDWQALAGSQPELFSQVPLHLLQRGNPRDAGVVDLLDTCMQLGHQNKTDFYVSRVQPIVKWPLGKGPQVDWTAFDSVVTRWLSGKGFSDRVPVEFWPLPAPDSLADFDLPTRTLYWQQAAEHFDQRLWLDRCPVLLQPESPGPITDAEAILTSAEARQILSTHPRVSTLLPLQDDQLELDSVQNQSGIALGTTSRCTTLAPGLVSPSPMRNWPDNALPPRHWINGKIPGLTSEQAVRTLAWLAFMRDASLVQLGNALPAAGAAHPIARSDQLPLLYPGRMYGTNAPVATLSLRWIRQAEQDYEYLFLAGQRDDRSVALKMCRLIARPLQLMPAQPTEPVFDLLAGTNDSHTCQEARQLIASRLQRNESKTPGNTDLGTSDPAELQTDRWVLQRQHPTLLGSSVQWMWNTHAELAGNATGGNDVEAVVGAYLYNPFDSTSLGSVFESAGGGAGWQTNADPVDVPPLGQYQVRSISTTVHFDLDKIDADAHQPLELNFVDGANRGTEWTRLMLPVSVSQRRTADAPIRLDGSLDEWFPVDAIQFEKPLVKMLDRLTLKSHALPMARDNASIFTGWSTDQFYLAFRLEGVTAADLRSTRNFVEYDHGRAWGEDLCEAIIQPIYIDNTIGPTLHVVFKPAGNWVEQQPPGGGSWAPFEASGVRYASSVDSAEKVWRGEAAIPWKAIESPNHGRPTLLRFNFIQHQNATGESASWAGPIDQSRDGKIAGLLVLKER